MNLIENLSEQLSTLAEAEQNLIRIRTEYANEPDLLSFYEPSAQFMVDSIKNQLNLCMASFIGENSKKRLTL